MRGGQLRTFAHSDASDLRSASSASSNRQNASARASLGRRCETTGGRGGSGAPRSSATPNLSSRQIVTSCSALPSIRPSVIPSSTRARASQRCSIIAHRPGCDGLGDQRRQQRDRALALLLADQLPQRHRGRRALRQFQTQLHDRSSRRRDHSARPGRHAQAAAPRSAAPPADRQARPARPSPARRPGPADRSMPPGPSGGCRPATPGSAPADPGGASTPSTQAGGPPTHAAPARSAPPAGSHRGGQCVVSSFDRLDHSALIGRMRRRIGDKRILGLVKAFLGAGILAEDGVDRNTITGAPQGGILSPCLANIALSVLDEHFTRKWEELGPEWTRAKHRKAGVPACRLVRYADDYVVMVRGARQHAEALWDESRRVLAPMGLRLSEEKTRVCHIDEGFDFLGYRIQRRSRRGRPGKRAVYTYPSKKALASVMNKVRSLTRRQKHRALADLLHAVNRVLRGWCRYFRHAVSAQTFSYLEHYTWHRVAGWIRKRHGGLSWGALRRLLPGWESG